ncbi:MAG: HAD family hydrolase [Clostridia bacterium]|nr:HAD family hydrolase [Clostridia bacterium]
MLKYVLFDLDGTLLPMSQEEFTKYYLSALCKKMAKFGFEPHKLGDSIWKGVAFMIKNVGNETNEELFWKSFEEDYGKDAKKYIPEFEEFYKNEFVLAKEACKPNAFVPQMIQKLKEKGLKFVVATNPIFPEIAINRRISWAGLERSDFELVTTYENSSSAKPNLKYYQDILNVIQAKPEECLMVGNDVSEDMVAKKLGLDVFLVTECLINRKNEDISTLNQGTFENLIEYIDKKMQIQA